MTEKEADTDSKDKEEEKEIKVTIDKERIFDRLTRITRLPDDEYGGMFGPE